MSESLDCPYKNRCKEKHTQPEMEKKRETCDCISCAFCDEYWAFYDKRHMEILNGKK